MVHVPEGQWTVIMDGKMIGNNGQFFLTIFARHGTFPRPWTISPDHFPRPLFPTLWELLPLWDMDHFPNHYSREMDHFPWIDGQFPGINGPFPLDKWTNSPRINVPFPLGKWSGKWSGKWTIIPDHLSRPFYRDKWSGKWSGNGTFSPSMFPTIYPGKWSGEMDHFPDHHSLDKWIIIPGINGPFPGINEPFSRDKWIISRDKWTISRGKWTISRKMEHFP